MPTYEYSCKECGEHLEVVQSFKDEPLTVCPACAGPMRKVFGNIGIAFKGSGFYRTDSRAGATKGTGAKSSESSPESSGKSSSSEGSGSSAAGAAAGGASGKPSGSSSSGSSSSSSSSSGSSKAAAAS
jgi:putative FmdB family regulatory protein